ncbi:MAG: hypothetical protein M0P35_07465, partial [Bacteroidales bacterium]|nr:hypothetical protein [Bacteroidales bacterium]
IPYTTNAEMVKNQLVIDRIKKVVDEVNLSLGKTEQIGRIALVADEWSVNSGELSATLKVKRKIVEEKYANVIKNMFN